MRDNLSRAKEFFTQTTDSNLIVASMVTVNDSVYNDVAFSAYTGFKRTAHRPVSNHSIVVEDEFESDHENIRSSQNRQNSSTIVTTPGHNSMIASEKPWNMSIDKR